MQSSPFLQMNVICAQHIWKVIHCDLIHWLPSFNGWLLSWAMPPQNFITILMMENSVLLLVHGQLWIRYKVIAYFFGPEAVKQYRETLLYILFAETYLGIKVFVSDVGIPNNTSWCCSPVCVKHKCSFKSKKPILIYEHNYSFLLSIFCR